MWNPKIQIELFHPVGPNCATSAPLNLPFSTQKLVHASNKQLA